jgi:hypothetical protein
VTSDYRAVYLCQDDLIIFDLAVLIVSYTDNKVYIKKLISKQPLQLRTSLYLWFVLLRR